ncbi:MAG: hypothetical protein GY771_12900 [bacterium]|nr:hypothetical protein [bacterium]
MRYLIPMLLIVNAAFSIGPYFITTGGIDDYGFDEELVSSNFPDWTFSGSGSFIREEYREYDGESYAIVDASTSGDNYFYQDLDADDLKEGQTYFLSFRYKILDDDLTVSTGGGAKVELAINEGPLSGTVYAATKPVSDETGDNWGMARVAFTARSTDSRFSVGMWDASGTLCVDDVRINVMEEDVGGTLVNPDFEPLGTVGPAPFGWTATPGLGGTITTVGGDIRSGSGAVDISQTSSGTSTLTQTITIDQMTRYRGYIYFYTDDVVGTGARVRIYQNKQLGTEELFLSDTYTGDNAWHRLPIDFTTIDDGTTITFELKLQATGTARFDGLFIRKMPILAGDFNDDDWDDYWLTDQASEGVVSRVDDPESIGNKVLEIENTGDGDTTTVYQDIAAIDGLSYVFSGRVRVDELASILDDKYGGYIKLIDNATEAIVDSAGPFTVEDEWTTWGLYGFAGPVEGAPPANRFRVELILYEASGTMFVDDVEVYSEALNDMVTVLPQPASADRRNTYGRVGDEEWYIVYDDSEIVGDPTRDDDAFRCADDVRNDLIFDEEIHPNYFHYFGIEEDINLVALSQYNPATHKPALLILDPDTQLYQTWVDGLMEDHGITEPEVAGLGDEGYYLDTGYDGGDEEVLILSTTAKGRYYGTQTFLQLLQHPMHIGENATKVYDYPDVTIYDTPEMPIRGVDIGEHTYKVKPGETGFDKREYQAFLFRERESEKGEGNPRRTPIEVYVRLMSRIKINTVLIETPMFYCLDYTDKYIDTDRIGLAESSNLDVLQRIFDYCRDYYIEPVPVLQSLGHACQMLQFVGTSAAENWLSVEACWVGDPDGYDADEIPLPQLLEVFEESNYTLDNPYVIESSERPITVYELDGDGDIVYGMIEGSDYTVDYIGMDFDLVRGYSFPEPWPVGSRNCKLNITRALPKGHEWAVEYHFINQPRLKA